VGRACGGGGAGGVPGSPRRRAPNRSAGTLRSLLDSNQEGPKETLTNSEVYGRTSS
jgi:hypothetical protein